MQKTVCPHCHKKLKFQEGMEGGTYECPKCHHGVTLKGGPGLLGVKTKRKGGMRRALLWSAIGLAILAGIFLMYQRVNEDAKQRQRDSHRILVQ